MYSTSCMDSRSLETSLVTVCLRAGFWHLISPLSGPQLSPAPRDGSVLCNSFLIQGDVTGETLQSSTALTNAIPESILSPLRVFDFSVSWQSISRFLVPNCFIGEARHSHANASTRKKRPPHHSHRNWRLGHGRRWLERE